MPSPSLAQRLRAVEETVAGRDRWVDLALALVNAENPTETILFAGGRWDRFDQRFTDEDEIESCVRIRLAPSQIAFARWFAEQLADYRAGYPRDIRLALAAGDRRGGKTVGTFFCQLAALLDVPRHPDGTPAIGWTISRTHRQRDELDQIVASYLPRHWYELRLGPERRITFVHGAYLRNLSADDPEALRQGRVDWLLYNEGQKMPPKAIVNGLYGTADRAGLTVIAANPPSDPSQEWLLDLKEAIEEDERFKRASIFFHFDSKQNPFINQPARADVEMIAKKIAPDGAEADAEGIWKRWGDMAYPGWNGRALDKGGLVGPPPKLGLVDVTTARTRREFGIAYPLVIGADFQKKPHEAAVLLRVYEDRDGRSIYWFTDETTVRGDEYELSASVVALGIRPGEALWIPDCSGSYQGSERIEGRTSFSMLESHGWHVEASEVPVSLPNSEETRIDLVLQHGRDPNNPWRVVVECKRAARDFKRWIFFSETSYGRGPSPTR